eukprot:762674-Hanusia_phi.AAC.2
MNVGNVHVVVCTCLCSLQTHPDRPCPVPLWYHRCRCSRVSYPLSLKLVRNDPPISAQAGEKIVFAAPDVHVIHFTQNDFKVGILEGAIPQVPTTLLNSCIAVCKLAEDLYPQRKTGVNVRSVSTSVSLFVRKLMRVEVERNRGAVERIMKRTELEIKVLVRLKDDWRGKDGTGQDRRAVGLSEQEGMLTFTQVGAINLVFCWFGGMPMCHGSGGLAGQHRSVYPLLSSPLLSSPLLSSPLFSSPLLSSPLSSPDSSSHHLLSSQLFFGSSTFASSRILPTFPPKVSPLPVAQNLIPFVTLHYIVPLLF